MPSKAKSLLGSEKAKDREKGGRRKRKKGEKSNLFSLSTLAKRRFSKLGEIKCHFQILTGVKRLHSQKNPFPSNFYSSPHPLKSSISAFRIPKSRKVPLEIKPEGSRPAVSVLSHDYLSFPGVVIGVINFRPVYKKDESSIPPKAPFSASSEWGRRGADSSFWASFDFMSSSLKRPIKKAPKGGLLMAKPLRH